MDHDHVTWMETSSNGSRKTQPQTWALAWIFRFSPSLKLGPSAIARLRLKPNRGFAVLVPCWLEERFSGDWEAGIWRYLNYGHVVVPEVKSSITLIFFCVPSVSFLHLYSRSLGNSLGIPEKILLAFPSGRNLWWPKAAKSHCGTLTELWDMRISNGI